jgi:hypothetical protein
MAERPSLNNIIIVVKHESHLTQAFTHVFSGKKRGWRYDTRTFGYP